MESLQKIKSHLESLQLLLSQIADSAQYSSIEKDIILAKLRDVYEMVLSGNTSPLHRFDNKVESIITIEPTIVEDITEKEFEEEMVKETTIELNEPLPVAKPKKHYDDDLLIRIDDVNTNERIESKPEIEQVQAQITKTVEVKPQNHSNESLAAKLSHTKIESIAAAISVGDKMMFQKQLFKDRNKEFLKTLTTVNELDSYEEAVAWLEASYSWDFNSTIVKKLLEIVQRRF
jgi:hypothetical protein